MFRLLVVTAFMAVSASWASGQPYTWNGPFATGSSTNWSAASWLGGTPPAGGGPAVTLTFADPNGDTTGYNAVNDLGANFQANQLNFTSLGGTISVNAGNGFSQAVNGILLTGTAPQVNQNGYGQVILNYLTLAAPTTVGGNGLGEFQLGPTTFTSTLTVNRPTAYSNMAFTTFNGTGAGAGGVTFQAGNFRIARTNALGTGPVTVNGGAFVSDGGSGTLPNNFTLNADLSYGGDRNSPGGLTLTGVLSGAGGVTVTDVLGYGTLTLAGANTYTGPTGTSLAGMAGQPSGGSVGDIYLVGPSGSIITTSAIRMLGGGSITLNNAQNAAGGFGSANNNNNRLAASTPVELSGAAFVLIGTLGATTAQAAGPLTVDGFSRVAVDASQTGNLGTALTFASLSRGTSRGTVIFQGNNASFGGTPGSGVANLSFNNPPTVDLVGAGGLAGTTTISILPYAYGQFIVTGLAQGTASLVTYGANGIRPLAAAEYATTVAAGANTNDNVKLAAALTLGATPTVVNSLTLNQGRVIGTGTIQIKSGALLHLANSSFNPVIANTAVFDFAGREAVVTTGSNLLFQGRVTNANGLTKVGPGTIVLSNTANALGGPLTVDGGTVAFTSVSALGSPSAIVLNGNGGPLVSTYAGATSLWDQTTSTALTFAPDVTLGAGMSAFRTDGTNLSAPVVTMTGVVSGPGGLLVEATAGNGTAGGLAQGQRA